MIKMKTYILIATLIISAVSSVFLTIESVATGSEVAGLNLEEKNLIAKQRELKETLVKGVSVSNLEEKSGELGFVPASSIIYINENEGVAAR